MIFLGFSYQAIIAIIITFLLLLLSGFMSASEVAYFALSPADIKKLDPDKRSNQLITKLLNDPQRLLATILTGNNLVNVSIVISSAYVTNHLISFGNHTVWEFVFNSVIITFLLLLFGEILPKIYASIFGVKFARAAAPALNVLEKILAPIALILVKSTTMIDKRMEKHKHNNISVDELSSALRLTQDDKTKKSRDNAILEGIVNFGSIYVSEVMTPRLDMTCISTAMSFKKVLSLITECGYSRIPVYGGTVDNIRGILYVKDLLPHLDKGDSFRWQSIVRPAYFVPDTKKIDDLLTDFQKNKIHIAIVVDEFGGTSGVVTMKDVLEEIMGDINDEYDDAATPLFKKIANDTYDFEAKIPLNDFFKLPDIVEDDFGDIPDEVETLAGLILELKGEIPAQGAKVHFKNYLFTILKADNRHIQAVRLHIELSQQSDTSNSDHETN